MSGVVITSMSRRLKGCCPPAEQQMSGVVITSAAGGVGVIPLSRPEKVNCLSMAVISGIDEAPPPRNRLSHHSPSNF